MKKASEKNIFNLQTTQFLYAQYHQICTIIYSENNLPTAITNNTTADEAYHTFARMFNQTIKLFNTRLDYITKHNNIHFTDPANSLKTLTPHEAITLVNNIIDEVDPTVEITKLLQNQCSHLNNLATQLIQIEQTLSLNFLNHKNLQRFSTKLGSNLNLQSLSSQDSNNNFYTDKPTHQPNLSQAPKALQHNFLNWQH